MKKKALYLIAAAFLFASCSQPNGGNTETGPEFPVVAPAVPAAPELKPGNNRLVLRWQAVSGADSYDVFCKETESGVEDSPVQTVNVTEATVSGLTNGTSYYVQLRAKNSAGVSGFSPAVTGTPAAQLPLPSVVRGNGRLSAGWAAEDGVTYEVWYGTSSDGEAAGKWTGAITRSGSVAGTTITGLTNGTPYYVGVKIENAETLSDLAEETPEAPPSVPGGFVYVPGGTITGSGDYAFTVTVPNDPWYDNPGATSYHKGVFVEGRRLDIASFVMAKYETTRQLWYDVQVWALEHGYFFQNKISAPGEANKNKPVTGISWRDAIVWCNAYSEKDGRQPVYTYGGNVLKDSSTVNAAACDGAVMDKTKSGYRLPTEVEREFAARGGDPGRADWMYMYAGSNNADTVAWHRGNSENLVRAVGTKNANRLGMYDLSGNVQEWCWDWMHWAIDVTAATPVDGAPYSGTVPLANQKAFNGGGFGSNPTMSCVTYRWGYAPDFKEYRVGFRVVRKP
jgi:formylglycine-generating enzyme required for sulfatase activity